MSPFVFAGEFGASDPRFYAAAGATAHDATDRIVYDSSTGKVYYDDDGTGQDAPWLFLTVPVGTTVTWVNHDDVPHTVTANDKAFTSKTMDTDEKFSQKFASVGSYPYFCAVHKHMTGQVIVK